MIASRLRVLVGRVVGFAIRLLGATLLGLFWVVILSAYVEFSLPLAIIYSLSVLAAFVLLHLWLQWPGWAAERLRFPSVQMWMLLPWGLLASLLITLGQIAQFLSAGDLPILEPKPTTELVLLPLLAICAYPLIEEIVFRGWIQQLLEDQFHAVVAIIVAAAVFAGFHSTGSFALRFMSGCFYGAAAWTSGSIWIAVALHAGSNAVVASLDLMSTLPAAEQWFRATAAAGPLWLDVAWIGLIIIGGSGAALWTWWVWHHLDLA